MHGRVSHILDDGGQEVGEAGEGVVAGEVDGCVDVVLVVCQAGEDLGPFDAAFGGAVADLQAFDGVGLFFVGEILCGAGGVGEAEPDDGGEEDGGGAL